MATEIDPSRYKIFGIVLAVLLFVYSITNWVDPTVISSKNENRTTSNYLIGLLYLILSITVAYVSLF